MQRYHGKKLDRSPTNVEFGWVPSYDLRIVGWFKPWPVRRALGIGREDGQIRTQEAQVEAQSAIYELRL